MIPGRWNRRSHHPSGIPDSKSILPQPLRALDNSPPHKSPLRQATPRQGVVLMPLPPIPRVSDSSVRRDRRREAHPRRASLFAGTASFDTIAGAGRIARHVLAGRSDPALDGPSTARARRAIRGARAAGSRCRPPRERGDFGPPGWIPAEGASAREGSGLSLRPSRTPCLTPETRRKAMMERVLLTGGNGFFGRRIAEALRRHEYDVATPGRPEFDLMDAGSTRRVVERLRPDIIVHSAAYYGGLGICIAEPMQIFSRNVVMGVTSLEAAAAAGVRKVMAIGSACSYPGAVAGDMKEKDFWSGPLHPSVEAYGFTKKVLEVGLRAYGRGCGIVGQMPIVT